MIVSSIITVICLLSYKFVKKRINERNTKIEAKFGNDPNEINRLMQ